MKGLLRSTLGCHEKYFRCYLHWIKVETSVNIWTRILKEEKRVDLGANFLLRLKATTEMCNYCFFHEREIMGAWSSISLQRNLKFMLVDTTRRVAIWSRYWIILNGVVSQKNIGKWWQMNFRCCPNHSWSSLDLRISTRPFHLCRRCSPLTSQCKQPAGAS